MSGFTYLAIGAMKPPILAATFSVPLIPKARSDHTLHLPPSSSENLELWNVHVTHTPCRSLESVIY